VGVLTTTDLGRSAISQGDLGFAKRDGALSLDRMLSVVDMNSLEGVLFIEPSALSVVTDEWGDLLESDRKSDVERFAAHSLLVEDFVGQQWGKHPVQPVVQQRGQKLSVHTHCHQKSLWGSKTTMDVFDRMGVDAELIDAGCCGMAGSFGFMESKYELSMTIAEQRLMPAVRGRDTDAWIVAGGTSCRHQILDATGEHAFHPIEAVARLLGLG
jgi:Fe-S oxidoreductase